MYMHMCCPLHVLAHMELALIRALALEREIGNGNAEIGNGNGNNTEKNAKLILKER